jgi:hypothetical protein
MAKNHLTVTDQHGKQIRGRVVYLQPKAERWRVVGTFDRTTLPETEG